jgi:DNA repair exonuclease SbcCD ATPase subunit
MIILKKIYVENFLSFEKESYSFLNNKLSVVTGENLDDGDNVRSCGSGKSGFVEAIYFSITGQSLRGVPVKNLVRRGSEKSKVVLHFSDSSDSSQYQITRFISNSKPATGELSKNGVSVPFASVKDLKDIVLSIMDISIDNLKETFILTKNNYEPFLSLTDSKIRASINNISNISSIDKVFEKISIKKSSLESSLSFTKTHVSKINGALEMLEKFIEKTNASNNFEQNVKRVDDFKNRLDQKKKSILDLKEDVSEIKNVIQNYVTISDSDADLLSKCQDFVDRFEIKIKKHNQNLLKLGGSIDILNNSNIVLEKKLKGSIECPSCKNVFVLGGEIEDIKSNILKNKKDVELLRQEYIDAEKEINSFKEKLKKAEAKISEIKKMRKSKESKLMLFKSQKNRMDIELVDLEHDENIIISKISELEKKILNPDEEISKLNLEKKELLTQVSELNIEIEGYQKDLQEIVNWKSRFSKFKHYLLTRILKNINDKINFELQQINENIRVSIEGFKIDSKGKISDKISTDVFVSDSFVGNYNSLSGGERAEINIASIVAIKKLLMESKKGMNLLVIDEIIESLDEKGVSSIMKYLKGLNNTVLCITHASMNSSYDTNDVIIQKKNCISYIKN